MCDSLRVWLRVVSRHIRYRRCPYRESLTKPALRDCVVVRPDGAVSHADENGIV